MKGGNMSVLITERALYKALKLFGTTEIIEALDVIAKALEDQAKDNNVKEDDFLKSLYIIPAGISSSSQPLMHKQFLRRHQIFRVLLGDAPYFAQIINSLMSFINGAPQGTNWLNNQS
jgi:hypothetical protein